MVLLGLVAVIVAVVLIFVRPGSSQGDEPDAAAAPRATDAATEKTAPPTVIPTEPPETTEPTAPPAADGDPCSLEKVTVEAVTDKTIYEAGEQPQLSMTITNTGENICVLNAGTKVQVFTITSGEEVYWRSSDCQVDPIDAEVSLTPATPISSTVPIVWDRTRSSVDTCGGPREAVPSGGASYHLSVVVDGFESGSSKQFLLY